jgi:hypothetical protein
LAIGASSEIRRVSALIGRSEDGNRSFAIEITTSNFPETVYGKKGAAKEGLRPCASFEIV